jgi:outer membrane protein assembly factor BamA
MKRALFLIVILLYSIRCFPQNSADSIKKGWNIGYLPAIAFDSDLGMFYGIIISPYDYGDGSRYPDYMQAIRFQIAGYTKGSSDHYVEYDSFTLIPGMRFLSRVRYVGYQAYPFFGFNGNASFYNHAFEVNEDPAYRSRMFYKQEWKNFQIYANIQDTIGKSRFQWHVGWELGNYSIDTINITRFNRKLNEAEKLPQTPTLFELYNQWGLIRDSEKNGGLVNSFMLGLIYDSRNRLTSPDKGMYTELNMRWMPSFLSKDHFSGLSVGIIHRQYFCIIKNRLTFAYRIWLNARLGGDRPYYTRQLLTTFASSEGFGGSSTLRGILMNRIVTDNFALGNFELRSRLINFRFIKQNWYFGAIGFIDAGRILKPVRIDLTNVPLAARNQFFRADDKTIHKTLGGGIKLVMNENFVLSADYARPLDPQDGISGLYLGLDYLF